MTGPERARMPRGGALGVGTARVPVPVMTALT